MLASKLIELKSLETERERLLARIGERDRRIRELEQQASAAAETQARVSELERRLAAAEMVRLDFDLKIAAVKKTEDRVRELEQKLAARDAQVARLEQELSDAIAWTPSADDDLTKIKGIGPKFAAMLRELGVTRYAQIAAWTEEDVRKVAEKLRVSASRIEKNGWIAAARAIAAG